MPPSQHHIARRNVAEHFNNDFLRSAHSRAAVPVIDFIGRLDRHGHAVLDVSQELSTTTLHIVLFFAFNLNLDYGTRVRFSNAVDELLQKMMVCAALHPLPLWLAPFGALNALRAARKQLFHLCNEILDDPGASCSTDLGSLPVLLEILEDREKGISFLSEIALSGA